MDEIESDFAGLNIEPSLLERLNSGVYDEDACFEAIHGRKLPQHLGLPVTRHCVIRGIRHHLEFATGEAAVFKDGPLLFKQAINARLIMSNEIPDMDDPDSRPYCFWHPDLPSESTLQKLVEKYPDIAYQVGRVCAIAGYNGLYKTLNILPEIAIAEEAQDRGNTVIYDLIMKETLRWKVFNDYKLRMLQPIPAGLNRDTALYKSLAFQQSFSEPDSEWPFGDNTFELGFSRLDADIKGDMGLFAPYTSNQLKAMPRDRLIEMLEKRDAEEKEARDRETEEEKLSGVYNTTMELLSSPLPVDLPPCDKDLLICMAAYRGDIDRYCRLRRPYFVRGELYYIVRGIYHNTQFAVWWSKQPQPHEWGSGRIGAALCARFIMNDDISLLLKSIRGDKDLIHRGSCPGMIHYPDVAAESTYKAVARASTFLHNAVAKAAVYAGYKELFDWMVIGPNEEFETVELTYPIWVEAINSTDKYYCEAIDRIAKERGIPEEKYKSRDPTCEQWKNTSFRDIKEHWEWHSLSSNPNPRDLVGADAEYWPRSFYDGAYCSAKDLELWMSIPEAWKPQEGDGYDGDSRRLDYEHWPKHMESEFASLPEHHRPKKPGSKEKN